jgi:hypothetical protein
MRELFGEPAEKLRNRAEKVAPLQGDRAEKVAPLQGEKKHCQETHLYQRLLSSTLDVSLMLESLEGFRGDLVRSPI